MSTQWFYVQNGQRIGPVALEQVKAVLASGNLPQDALVWNQGLSGWVPAHTLPELAPAPAPVYAPPPQAFPAPAPFAAPAPQPGVPQPVPYAAPAAPLYASQAGPDTGGPVPPMAIQLLKQTRPWVRFMGILGFVQLALMVLGALGMMAMSATSRVGALPVLAAGTLYLVMAGVFLPAVLSLNRYASRITDLERSGHHKDLEAALAAQKGFWKYVGILTLISFCLAILGIILAVVLGLGALSLR